MISRYYLIFVALAVAGSLAYFANTLQNASASVSSAKTSRTAVAAALDALSAEAEAKDEPSVSVPVRRMVEQPVQSKWLTPFSKELSVGRVPAARVSTDWTDVRREYHVKGRAPESAKVPVGEKTQAAAPAREIADDDATVWPIWWRAWEDKGSSRRRKR